MLKQVDTKRDYEKKPQAYNFGRFKTGKILMLLKRYESPEVKRRNLLHKAVFLTIERGLITVIIVMKIKAPSCY